MTGNNSRSRAHAARTLAVVSLMALGLTACGEEKLLVTGAGASAPARVYDKWAADFERQNPNVEIVYDALGSSRGVDLFFNGNVSFATTEVRALPIGEERDDERGFLQVPITIGATVLAFNLGSIETINLSRAVIAGIYLGEITSWRDPRIAALNPDVNLPNRAIVPVHRVDGSGTTNAFTQYLSADSAIWKDRVGSGSLVHWPTPAGALGTHGMLQTIRYTHGAIGYLSYSAVIGRSLELGLAKVENRAGAHVRPTVASMKEAVDVAEGELLAEIEAESEGSYPIVMINYALLRQHYADPAVAKAVGNYLLYGLSQSSEAENAYGFSQLPTQALGRARSIVQSIIPGNDGDEE